MYFREMVQVKDGHERRYPTGKIGYLGSGINIVSRYLRPSIGSCHDFCKYGEEHALEMKEGGPMLMSKRIIATHGEGQELDVAVVREEVVSSKKKGSSLSKQVSLPLKIDLFLKHVGDPIKKAEEEHGSDSINTEATSSKQLLAPIKEEDVVVKHASDPFNGQVLSLANKETIKDVAVHMKGDNEPINREVTLLLKNETISPIKDVDVHLKHDNETIARQVLLLAEKEAVSSRQVSTSLKQVDAYMKHASDPIDKQVSSLACKVVISSSQVLTSTKEEDVFMKHASDPFNREVSSIANKEANLSGQILTPIKEEHFLMKQANKPTNREVLSLDKKKAISSRVVSTPLKKVVGFMKPLSDPKLKKPMKSNLSSMALPRYSYTQGDRKIRKTKQKDDPSLKSLGFSSVRRKNEINTSKEMRSSIRAERRISVPPAVSLSSKHSVKRPSSGIVEKSNNLNGVSHVSNHKTVRKPKHEQCSSKDVPEKTLHTVELNSARKTIRPVANGICATSLSPSSSSSLGNRSLKRAKNGIHTAVLPLSSVKRNLRHIQAKVQTAQSPQSWPSSPKSKVVRSNQLGTHVTGSNSSSLPSSSSAKSLASSEQSERESENRISRSKKENKSMPIKAGTISLKVESGPGQKLAFRRGKVVELKQEDHTPRRLKFKQKLPGNIHKIKGDASRVSTLANKEPSNEGAGFNTTECRKVVLRRQDAKGKRNSGDIYNNVIEDTVSKLVKTRASKVKALVGAFESLISLQDTKPLVTTGAS